MLLLHTPSPWARLQLNPIVFRCCQRRLKPFVSEDTLGPGCSQYATGARMEQKLYRENKTHQKCRRFQSVKYGHA